MVERVAPAGRAGDLAAVEQAPDSGNCLGEPVETLAEAGPEVDPERLVLTLEPRPAEAHDRPAATDVVDGRDRLRREPRVAERVRPDEQPEPDPLRRLGQGGQRGIALEDRLVRLAEDREDVIPRPEGVVAELVGPLAGRQERRPVGRLAPQIDAQLQIGHATVDLPACASAEYEYECTHAIALC